MPRGRWGALAGALRGARTAASIALLCAGPPAAAQPAGGEVDRVVAVVEGSPITASEVAFEAELRARVARAPDPSALGRLLREPIEPLEAVLFERVLRTLPRWADVPADPLAGAARLAALEGAFATAEELDGWLRRWGLDRPRLTERLTDSDRLDRLVDLSVTASVTDEEQRAYYERHKETVFGGRSFDAVAPVIAERVLALAFDAAYNDWRTALRARASKRYVGR